MLSFIKKEISTIVNPTILNSSFEITFPIPDNNGAFRGFNFISLNTPDHLTDKLECVFDKTKHIGCLYYYQVNTSTYKLTLFTKELPIEEGKRLSAYLNHLALDPNIVPGIHKLVDRKVVDGDSVIVYASIFVTKPVWDKQTDPTLLDQLNTAFNK